MGIALDRFYFYPAAAPTIPALLVRVVRPTAPNFAEPAVEFAEALADVKAEALAWAWLVAAGAGEARPPAPLGAVSPQLHEATPEDAGLLAFHGRELELWWTAEEQRPEEFAIGPGVDEAEFWEWLAAALDDDDRVGRLRRPATRIRVQLVTEADARLVDTPLLLVDDVDWLTAEEFAHLDRGGGLAALTARPPATSPTVSEEEFRAVKRGLVERALADDLARGDRRAAAFRASDLARFDPPAALALIDRLAGSLKLRDDRKCIAWALAYALHGLRGEPGRAELLERWRAASGRFKEEVLAELAKHRLGTLQGGGARGAGEARSVPVRDRSGGRPQRACSVSRRSGSVTRRAAFRGGKWARRAACSTQLPRAEPWMGLWAVAEVTVPSVSTSRSTLIVVP